MPLFIVRVELLDGPKIENYHALYQAMSSAGFSDEIRGSDGALYKMQPGEYQRDAQITLGQARDSVIAAAANSGKPASVFVTQAADAAWNNLPLLQQPGLQPLGLRPR